MNQNPQQFSAWEYVLAIVGVMVGNMVFAMIFVGHSSKSIFIVAFQFFLNIALFFFFQQTRTLNNPWTIGFLVQLCLSAIPILLFLGLFGLCALTAGN